MYSSVVITFESTGFAKSPWIPMYAWVLPASTYKSYSSDVISLSQRVTPDEGVLTRSPPTLMFKEALVLLPNTVDVDAPPELYA